MNRIVWSVISVAALIVASPGAAQQPADEPQLASAGPQAAEPTEEETPLTEGDAASLFAAPAIRIQHYRPQDQRGIHMFEPSKESTVPWNGFEMDFGAAFAQQFQALDHSNSATEKSAVDAAGRTYNANQLMEIGGGFNLATANLYLNAQLAPGIRVALATYLSSRHHQETWVKDGYLQIDASPIDHPLLNEVMEYVTIKAGMMELNYGDAHFRRTDNGQALHNPFVGNYLLDAFTTEIGTEVYVRDGGWMVMGGITGGVNKGDVTNPSARGLAYLSKVGFDQQINPLVRVRLTGSMYTVGKTPSATLYAGDRAGSRYYLVLENTQATTNANFSSGLLNPGFRNELTAVQMNPFIQLGGLEIFGVLEQAKGKASSEPESRTWNQYAADVVYRFLADDRLFVGTRYNRAYGELAGMEDDVGAERWQLSGGWFITPTILVKGEYVNQHYFDFPSADIRNGGQFDGFMVEGVVAF